VIRVGGERGHGQDREPPTELMRHAQRAVGFEIRAVKEVTACLFLGRPIEAGMHGCGNGEAGREALLG